MASGQKNIFVVLGVARSGTSTITRALKALGIDLGKTLTPANERWNPKGFWEDNDIVYKINGGLFNALNFPSYGIECLDAAQQLGEPVREIKQAAIDLLTHRFADTSHWGFKDPSTVKLLAFWQDIFKTLAIEDHYVIALRNPLSSAQSYQNRFQSEVGVEIALLVWLMHVLPAIEGTMGKKRIVVSYEGMLNNPGLQLERMRTQLDIQLPFSQTELDIFANEFLDKKLHRYQFTRDDLKNHPASAVVPLCLKAYDWMMKLARDEIRFDDEQFIQSWQDIKNELAVNYPLFLFVDTLLKNNRQLDKSLRTIQKSWLWKMSYPFRKLSELLGRHRRKKRAERRILKAYG